MPEAALHNEIVKRIKDLNKAAKRGDAKTVESHFKVLRKTNTAGRIWDKLNPAAQTMLKSRRPPTSSS